MPSDRMTKSEQTRAFIIEKIAPVFNRKGYAGTSLSDMTEATKLTKGSIYGNFANKDEVALAVFDYNVAKVNEVVGKELAKHVSARDKLIAYARVYAEFEKFPFPGGGCPVMNTAVESDDTHPELRKKAAQAINSWKKNLMEIISAGIKQKEFRKGIDTEQTAVTMISMIEGGLLIARTTNKPEYRMSVMESLKHYIDQLK